VALVSLTTLSPQPRSTGIQTTRRSYGADSTVLDEGRFVELEFDFSEDPTAYGALLTLFGINSALYAAVTVYVRDEKFAFVRMNGVAIRPQPAKEVTWERFFPRNITILVRDLSTAS